MNKLLARQAKEREGQAAVVGFLHLALPVGAAVYVIPGGDGKVTTVFGYVPGTADVLALTPVSCGAFIPFWFETKRLVGGRKSAAQIAEQQRCRRLGMVYEFVRRPEDVIAVLEARGVQLRARLT